MKPEDGWAGYDCYNLSRPIGYSSTGQPPAAASRDRFISPPGSQPATSPSAHWHLGKARVAGPVFLCYMAFFIIVPIVITTATPWMKLFMIVAWFVPAGVVAAEAWRGMRGKRRE